MCKLYGSAHRDTRLTIRMLLNHTAGTKIQGTGCASEKTTGQVASTSISMMGSPCQTTASSAINSSSLHDLQGVRYERHRWSVTGTSRVPCWRVIGHSAQKGVLRAGRPRVELPFSDPLQGKGGGGSPRRNCYAPPPHTHKHGNCTGLRAE